MENKQIKAVKDNKKKTSHEKNRQNKQKDEKSV